MATALAVWDVHDGDWFTNGLWQERSAWLKEFLWRPKTYRVEFHLIDCPYAVVYSYKTRNGKCYKEGDDVAREAPFTVILRELPPDPLLAGDA